MRARVLGTIVLAAAGLTLAACTTTPTGTPATGRPTTHAVPPPIDGGRQVSAGEADNGRTITIAVGDRLDVTLHNTYWHFGAVASGKLLAARQPVATVPAGPGAAGCVPGEGCGTVTEAFDAATPGTAEVTASRTTCGEARGCTGDQGSYRLTVVIH